jgi:hypothetical protein
MTLSHTSLTLIIQSIPKPSVGIPTEVATSQFSQMQFQNIEKNMEKPCLKSQNTQMLGI